MKAAVCARYGPPEVLKIEEVSRPAPRTRDLLIKTHASTVNSSDWFIRSGLPDAPFSTRAAMKLLVGIRRPRRSILGLVLAGEVAETGRRVQRFRVGDRVYAFTKFHFGGYAQYTCLPATATIAIAPSNLSYEEAAAIPYGGLLGLHFLRKGEIRAG